MTDYEKVWKLIKVKFLFCFHFSDPYIVALRSVTVTAVPPQDGYIRGETQCAGFLIWSKNCTNCKVGPSPF